METAQDRFRVWVVGCIDLPLQQSPWHRRCCCCCRARRSDILVKISENEAGRPYIVLAFVVKNLMSTALLKNVQQLEKFKSAIEQALASTTEIDVMPEHVVLSLDKSEHTITVDVVVYPPTRRNLDKVESRLNSHTQKTVAEHLSSLAELFAGPIEVDIIRKAEVMVGSVGILPAMYEFRDGRQDSYGDVQFPSAFTSQRWVEVQRRHGWMLRFAVFESSSNKLIAHAQIEVTELTRQSPESRSPWREWELLLTNPDTEEAIYNSTPRAGQGPRRPAFIKVRTQPSWLPMISRPDQWRRPPPSQSQEPKKHAMIITRGTRGDLQPFVALARGLVLHRGCVVTIVTELKWKQFIKDSQQDLPKGSLHFRPCGGNTEMKINTYMSQMAMYQGQHWDALQALMFSRAEVEFFPSEGCFYHWAQKVQPDFIVFGMTLVHIAMILSEALGIPIVGFILQPSRSIEERHPVTVMDEVLRPLRQNVTSEAFNNILQQIMEKLPVNATLNELRRSRGLHPTPREIVGWGHQYKELLAQAVRMIVPISKAVLAPCRQDQLGQLTLTEFIFLRLGPEERLRPDICSFIDAAHRQGKPVCAMTFSSMPVGKGRMLKLAVEICNHCEVMQWRGTGSSFTERRRVHVKPALIVMIKGQGAPEPTLEVQADVGTLETRGCLMVVPEAVPFGALFPLVDGLILHGGLGVTSEAMLAGKPVVTTGIGLMDQRYWGTVLNECGCGSNFVPIDRLFDTQDLVCNESRICVLLREALDGQAERAQELMRELQTDGVKENTDAVYLAGTQDATVVDQAFLQRARTCMCMARQSYACIKCLCCCFNWFLCNQLPGCAILLLKVAQCRPLHYVCLMAYRYFQITNQRNRAHDPDESNTHTWALDFHSETCEMPGFSSRREMSVYDLRSRLCAEELEGEGNVGLANV